MYPVWEKWRTLVFALAMSASVMPSSAQPLVDSSPPTVADPLRGLDLWQGAKVGMTATDLERRFPKVQHNSVPVVLTGGQSDLFVLPQLVIEGHLGSAHFFFNGEELSSVEIIPSDFKAGRTSQNLAEAKSIAAAYSRRYGAGYDCGYAGRGDESAYECKWLQGRLAVQLWYMDVAGQAPLFYIAYKQADDPSYNL